MKRITYRGIYPFTTIWFFNFSSYTFVRWDDTEHCKAISGNNEYLIAIFKIKWK